MMIFKKAIPRRTFLRGVGATVALPFLDSMVPAFAGPLDTAAKPVSRLSVVYAPNGMWPMDKWTPKAEGASFEITPTLEPLAPFRDQMLVLSGLSHDEAMVRPGNPGDEDHSLALSTYLSCVHPQRVSKDIRVGISMDQIAAKEMGKHTQLGSLELSLLRHSLVGSCEGTNCTLLSTVSWRDPATPLPMEFNPRAVFERLFGDSDSTDAAVRRAQLKEDGSILDWVTDDLASFSKGLGPSDRGKVNQYLDSIRDIERRIHTAEEQSSRELPSLDRPTGVPDSLTDYSKLMSDLQVLAYQCDMTRVITFMMGREGPNGSVPYHEIGIPDTHHTLSHHQNDPEKIDKLFRINVYHAQLFAYFLNKLKSTPDGDGSLLDHLIMLYGSGMSNGNGHVHVDLPVLLIGGGAGKLKGGRHIRYPQGTQMANLHLTILDKLGIRMEKIGNSTGELEQLSVV